MSKGLNNRPILNADLFLRKSMWCPHVVHTHKQIHKICSARLCSSGKSPIPKQWECIKLMRHKWYFPMICFWSSFRNICRIQKSDKKLFTIEIIPIEKKMVLFYPFIWWVVFRLLLSLNCDDPKHTICSMNLGCAWFFFFTRHILFPNNSKEISVSWMEDHLSSMSQPYNKFIPSHFWLALLVPAIWTIAHHCRRESSQCSEHFFF